MIKRRDFLKALPLVLAPGGLRVATAALAATEPAAPDPPVVKRYNELGKTGLKVGDIGFGVAVSADPQLLVDAFHRGVNYFDISPPYSWSVEMLAAAFARDQRLRREAIVASKLECEGLLYRLSADPVSKVEPCIDSLLRKLGREQLDIVQIHSMGENGREDLDWGDPRTKIGAQVAGVFERLKRAGKIRCSGVSSHGPRLLNEAMERAIGNGFDMVMPALNFRQTPELRAHLAKAAERQVGVIAMKVLANAKQASLPALGGRPFSHAAIAWALSQPGVNGMVITIKDRAQLDEYLGASGLGPSVADGLRLQLLALATAGEYCVTGCGRCAAACPHGVDAPTLLRVDQYWTNYGLPQFAAERFAGLPDKGSFAACAACSSPRCERACPHGVKVRQRVAMAMARFASAEGTLA